MDRFDDESILPIGHLGIVPGTFDSLGITGVMNRAIPKNRHHNLSHALVFEATMLKDLGFDGRRVYLFPEFFDDITVEHLLGNGINRK